jgi:hypothetical protein
LVVAILFLIYAPLGFLYIIGGVICCVLIVVRFIPKAENEEKKGPFFSTPRGTNVNSSAWVGAIMDEEEARRKQADKEPRDQGH